MEQAVVLLSSEPRLPSEEAGKALPSEIWIFRVSRFGGWVA